MLKMWSKPCVKMHFWPVPMKTFREIFGLMDTLTTELLDVFFEPTYIPKNSRYLDFIQTSQQATFLRKLPF